MAHDFWERNKYNRNEIFIEENIERIKDRVFGRGSVYRKKR
ncbi:hypothetical protein F383_33041 [Gossypium arboreum]|uniref:Uncharacterized protein n=1 Tax=Gossypium arboreum TaxID=29729 RepID=A0A0B0PUP6_GOSAR|nr:hypothetical protein F383_19080 [Gossypium arboreum]KHG27131.1 hypothetical protein F383_33041 [Gossypium arboreum]